MCCLTGLSNGYCSFSKLILQRCTESEKDLRMGSRIKDKPKKIFEAYMEVIYSETKGPERCWLFPEDYTDQETLQIVPKFCFPFRMDSVAVRQVGKNFTFVLTDVESKQRFGFCQLSDGAQSCYCFLSYLPWFEVFYKLLNMLANYTNKGQESLKKESLESLHALPIPDPGMSVYLNMQTCFTVPDLRELPSIPENRNLTEYFVAVDVNNMLHLYASMLYERRVLISSSNLSTLTACVHGAAATLYPMYWQHVYIPVLPQHLLDYCCAPMPYLIGVHSSLMEVRVMALDDVVILNVDSNTLETPFDDLQNLPNDVVSTLKNRLKKVSTTMGNGAARAFLKSQAALFGSYRSALRIEPDEPITFNEDAFITHRSNTMRQFLQNATQLQLFKQFIDGRLELLNSGEGFNDVFEEEINMGEYAGSDKVYHQWLLTFKKGGGAIFNTVKTKANPAMKTVYKFAKDHAKMGIKEVRSRLKQKEMAENSHSSSRDDSTSTWEQRRPITVHLGQSYHPWALAAKRPRSNLELESSHEHDSSFMHPTRHYTVFLCEDSSGDELSQDDDFISAFPDHFLLSTPFQWSQSYQSLKDTELVEKKEEAGTTCFQGRPTMHGPIHTKLSELSLLDDSFSNQQEKPTYALHTITTDTVLDSGQSLEEPSPVCKPIEQHGNFSHQHTELSGDENTQTLLGLKHTSYNRFWRQKLPDTVAFSSQDLSSFNTPLSVLPLEPCTPSNDRASPGPEMMEERSITIPRPQAQKKLREPGAVLSPTVTLLKGLRQDEKEGAESVKRQVIHQTLNTPPLTQSQPPSTDPGPDLLHLLDPLSGGEEPYEPSRPPRPALTPLQGQRSLNPFTQVPHYFLQKYYNPVPPDNTFSTAYLSPQTTAYFHTPPVFMFSQASPVGGATMNGAWPVDRASPASSSSTSLYSLIDSPAPSCLSQVLPPTHLADKPNDPFSDLLTMATSSTVITTQTKRKMEDLHRKWETFD
ncbi:DENN domain-containing protein 1A isoform X2 [Ictalurus punctatus]|uniref:DENN domain-containing protein 1A isoform X2 n=1 Tax=Ictalurus punctatus TaxID=7998 RepID=A0A2D0SZ86_ICTPU|nr:DENN domain-containing protein 1A isoform X2 [Ictalurus punctatus]